MNDNVYLVAGCKPWSSKVFEEAISHFPGKWHFISKKEELNETTLSTIAPRYIFFLHWSWIVPKIIVNRYECVCFHMTDVPFGRGGSPLQNLIFRGYTKTKLTALRMAEELDAGPVYFKEELSLEGSAEEIYIRASRLSAKMIMVIVKENPVPILQIGEPVIFQRRKPEESRIPSPASITELYDFIRMLDAEGYPKAFFDFGKFRFELQRASLKTDSIIADVKITLKPEA